MLVHDRSHRVCCTHLTQINLIHWDNTLATHQRSKQYQLQASQAYFCEDQIKPLKDSPNVSVDASRVIGEQASCCYAVEVLVSKLLYYRACGPRIEETRYRSIAR